MDPTTTKFTNIKGVTHTQNFKGVRKASYRVKKTTEPNEVIIPDKLREQLHSKDASNMSSISEYSSQFDETHDIPTHHDLSPHHDRASFDKNAEGRSFFGSTMNELDQEDRATSLADNLVDDVLKTVVKETRIEVPTFIKIIVDDVITSAYHGSQMDKLHILSSSDDEKEEERNDNLSSLSVIGTDESDENRDVDSIPNVSQIRGDRVRKPEVSQPDIEIFDTKLSDKLVQERPKNEKIMIVGEYQDMDNGLQDESKETKVENIKKNIRRKALLVQTKVEKKREACCGVQLGGCNIF